MPALWWVLAGLGGLLLLVPRNAAAAVPAGGDRVVSGEGGAPQPRGIRNHNPGNLRPGDHWRGATGEDEAHYLVFSEAHWGLRAMAINLLNQQRRHHLDTLRAIFTKYAPPSENDTDAYVAAMARALGVGADEQLDLLHDRAQFTLLVRAVIRHENGVQPYGDAELERAIAAAYNEVLS